MCSWYKHFEQRVTLTTKVSAGSAISRRTDEEASRHMSDECDDEQGRALNSAVPPSLMLPGLAIGESSGSSNEGF